MRTTRVSLAMVTIVLALAVSTMSAANASTPTAETMVLVQDGTTYETLGWSASGTFADSGQWTVDRLILGPPAVPILALVDTTFTSSGGSFRVAFHGGTNPIGSVVSSWRAYGGSGIYRGIAGTGTWTQAFDAATDQITFVLTGRVHFQPS